MKTIDLVIGILFVVIVVGGAVMVRRMLPHAYVNERRIVDTVRLARVARVAVYVWLATDVAVTLASLQTISVLGGFGGPIAAIPALRRADTLTTATGLLYVIAFVATGLAVLRWIYLTNRNAQALNPAMTVTPGWAVLWFFIPIASLWKPFDGMRQTWQASADPQAPDAVPVPALLRWWWGLWVVTSIMGNIAFSLSTKTDTVNDLITANAFTLATLPVDIALAIALTTMMRRLSQMQRDVAGGAAQARPETVEDAALE